LIDEPLESNQKEFIEEETHLGLDLEAKLWNAFSRITLVNQEASERLTIDCDLSFSQGNNHMTIEDLVICEVKQEKQNRHSPFMREVKRRLIRPDSISKYCLGVTMLYPEIKSNNFKAKILKIRKIKNGMVT